MKLLLLIALLVGGTAFGQKFATVDLSKKVQNEPTIDLDNSGIKLTNKIPNGSYKVKIEVEEESNGLSSAAAATADTTECEKKNLEFLKAYNKLKNEKDEGNIPDEKNSLKARLGEATSECKAELQKKYDVITAATEEEVPFTFTLQKNQNIIATVTREDEKGNVEKKWVVVLRTPRKVNYITHFGFSFAPKGEKIEDQFYSKKDTGNSYLITHMNKNGDAFWKDLSLTANFIIFPFKMKQENPATKIGIVAGTGINADLRWTVFAGPSLVLNDFFSFNVCPGLFNQYRLRGIYTPGQRITENLSFDQLHEQGPRLGLVISVGLRLSKEQAQEGVSVIGGASKTVNK